MFLYLVQHAEAKSEQEDPSRGLTEKGAADIQRVADYISRSDIKVKEIYHSGKARAVQSAQIMADHIKPEKGVLLSEGLAPKDDPETWVKSLSNSIDSIMLVGHLPHLGRLSSLLLCGDSEKGLINFRMGGIVCLKRTHDGKWSVEWMLTPEVVR